MQDQARYVEQKCKRFLASSCCFPFAGRFHFLFFLAKLTCAKGCLARNNALMSFIYACQCAGPTSFLFSSLPICSLSLGKNKRLHFAGRAVAVLAIKSALQIYDQRIALCGFTKTPATAPGQHKKTQNMPAMRLGTPLTLPHFRTLLPSPFHLGK